MNLYEIKVAPADLSSLTVACRLSSASLEATRRSTQKTVGSAAKGRAVFLELCELSGDARSAIAELGRTELRKAANAALRLFFLEVFEAETEASRRAEFYGLDPTPAVLDLLTTVAMPGILKQMPLKDLLLWGHLTDFADGFRYRLN